MGGLVLDLFGVVGHMPVPSRSVVHIVGVLFLDVGNELGILGDIKAYNCQRALFCDSN